MKTKILIDRKQPDTNEINVGKDFNVLFQKFTTLAIPFYKTKLFLYSCGAATGIALGTLYVLSTTSEKSGNNSRANKTLLAASKKNEQNESIQNSEQIKPISTINNIEIAQNKTTDNNHPEKTAAPIETNKEQKISSSTNLSKAKSKVFAHINGKVNGNINYSHIKSAASILTNNDTVYIISFKISYIVKNTHYDKHIDGNKIPQPILIDMKNIVNHDKVSITEIHAKTKSGKKIQLDDLNFNITGTYDNKNETGVLLDDELLEKRNSD